jgi:hypothetical protein
MHSETYRAAVMVSLNYDKFFPSISVLLISSFGHIRGPGGAPGRPFCSQCRHLSANESTSDWPRRDHSISRIMLEPQSSSMTARFQSKCQAMPPRRGGNSESTLWPTAMHGAPLDGDRHSMTRSTPADDPSGLHGRLSV